MIGNAGPTCIVQETGDCQDDPDEAFHYRAFRDAAHVPAIPYHQAMKKQRKRGSSLFSVGSCD